MAQVSQIEINNQAFSTFRTTMNDSLSAINSMHSGTSRPASATTGTLWLDTTNAGSNSLSIKFFDGSDDITFATVDTSANTVNFTDSALDLVTDLSPQLGGNLDTNSNDILFADNDKAIFGAGSDLQIYHDPSEGSIVRDAGSGNLVLAGNDVQITNGARNETHIDCNNNGAVELYHDNSKKFETTSGGVAVTGDFTATGNISAGNNGSIFLLDNIGQKVGQLTNDSSSSHSLQIDADPDNSGANTYMQFKIDDSEKARIDANGNLLLNTSSASGFDSAGLPLIVGSGSTHQGITIFSGTSHQGAIHFADGTGTSSYRGQLNYKHDADAMTFATSGAEKARLDTNGTLLVGKTATNIGTAGIELTHDNVILGTRSGGVAQYLNRLSSDGSILELMKDGTTVGSIGVSSSDNLTFGATTGGGSGLLFYGAGGTSPIILPMKENAQIDNAVDLGGNGNAFKDLYLGGKLYVGSQIRTNSSSSTLSIRGGSTYPGAKIEMAGGQASSNPGTIIFSTDDGNVTNVSERARIDADGNFGIGESAPLGKFHVKTADSGASVSDTDDLIIENGTSGAAGGISILSATNGYGNICFGDSGDNNIGVFQYDHNGNFMRFIVNASERARLDASGNFLVGKTSTTFATAGVNLQPNGRVDITRDGGQSGYFNRTNSDGAIVGFYKDGTAVGSIGSVSSVGIQIVSGSSLDLYSDNANGVRIDSSGRLRPINDNSNDLGNTNKRWNDIYATNGTIQTSDQNEKQSIQSLTIAEMNVAKKLSALIKTFKWNTAVEKKGDSARTHTGIIAQDIQQAFTDEELDASNYALFISSTWWEKEISVEATKENNAYTYIDTKEEATDGYTEKTRLGVRYPELLSFIQAYNDQRFTELEARITTLEANNP